MTNKSQMLQINDMLFDQIKLLSKTKEIKKEQLRDEVERAKAMALLSSQYIAGETLEMRRKVITGEITNTSSVKLLTNN